jgi:hypothetical protein
MGKPPIRRSETEGEAKEDRVELLRDSGGGYNRRTRGRWQSEHPSFADFRASPTLSAPEAIKSHERSSP